MQTSLGQFMADLDTMFRAGYRAGITEPRDLYCVSCGQDFSGTVAMEEARLCWECWKDTPAARDSYGMTDAELDSTLR